MQAVVILLVSDVMPIYMIISLNIIITMRFSINCPIVICSPTVCYVLEREASSENYGPGSTFIIYKNTKIPCCNFVYFIIFCNLVYYLPLRDFILANNHWGDWQPPCLRWVQVFAFVSVCVVHKALCDSPTGLISLVLNWGKYLLITHKYRGSIVAFLDK